MKYSDEKNPYDDDNQCLEETISYYPCSYLRKVYREGYEQALKDVYQEQRTAMKDPNGGRNDR